MVDRRMMRQFMGHDPFDDPFFRDPFDNEPFGGGFGMLGRGNQMRISNGQQDDGFGGMSMMMPMMGMGGMGGGTSMMSNMGGGSGMMIMSSSSFSNNGREVHSSTTQARMGPGGVAEIQRQERDGRTGREQILLERRLGERARRVEKTRNLNTGEEETFDNLYGIEDGQEEYFDSEFQQAAQNGYGYQPHRRAAQHPRASAPLLLQAQQQQSQQYQQQPRGGQGYQQNTHYQQQGSMPSHQARQYSQQRSNTQPRH